MGQTLTHGIYLPDKGERNCYNGLAANWQLLDGAVGTIAEHTSQIAGKAPLVHTHTKADITDFPALATVATSGSYNDLSNIPASFTPASHTHGNLTNDGKVGTTANVPLITGTDGVVQAGSFGNAANTFCEGNDSRLSDARTPVAHTHTKSDVTDLLNSNFIPSANNTYDLGSSSYQWNNLYAKNYYYKGVAWGLDKSNVWSAENQFTNITRKFFSAEKGTIPSSNNDRYEYIKDKNGVVLGYRQFAYNTAGSLSYIIWLQNSYTNNQLDPNGSDKVATFGLNLKSDGSKVFSIYADALPNNDNSFNLGLSNRRWKSLNGINPGALSLPDYDSTAKLNITSTLPAPNANNIISYTPTMSGWLYVYFNVANATTSADYFYAEIKDAAMDNANAAQVFWRSKPAGDLPVFFPVIANKQFRIEINFTGYTVKKALLIPSMGHVA